MRPARLSFRKENSQFTKTVNAVQSKIAAFMWGKNADVWNLMSEDNMDCDQVCSYRYDGSTGDIEELRVLAIKRVEGADGESELLLLTLPYRSAQDTVMTDEWIEDKYAKCEESGYGVYGEYAAYTLLGGGVCGYFTAVNLAANLPEYKI